ncbi:MAG: tRNA lysidine(34) synthetase TilS [Pseudomonadota bacterium]
MPDFDVDESVLGGPPSQAGRLAVAVSGGADSFSLLHKLYTEGYDILALTVNHGLRPEAAKEAEKVASWCGSHSIPHWTLRWEGEKPQTGIQAAARKARYHLLIKACQREAIDRLVTAHHQDDQAETVLMRLRRGSGLGLAAIRAEVKVASADGGPLTLARPLLTTARRSQLLAYAEHHNLPFVHDPSNDDDRFERIRMRALLAALEQQELLMPKALSQTAAQLQAVDDQRHRHILDDAERAGVDFTPSGGVKLHHPGRATDLPALLQALAHALGKGEGIPLSFFQNLPAQGRRVSYGVEVMADKGQLWLIREAAQAVGRADGTSGVEKQLVTTRPLLWDDHFVLHPPKGFSQNSYWAPLGAYLPQNIATTTLKRRALCSLPCLVENGQVTHILIIAQEDILRALTGWKGAEEFLNNIQFFEGRNIVPEKFYHRVIWY